MNKKKQRLLKEWRESLSRSIEYFASSNKPERERWVCHELLHNLNRRHWERSVVSSQDEPPDVIYRSARFEIKEILDKGRRRHKEYRDELKRALTVSDPDEMFTSGTVKDATPEQIAELVLERLAALQKKYAPATTAALDILFYVNLLDTHYKKGPMPKVSLFAPYGWRSVSAVLGTEALVFAANKGAPKFLRDAVGKVSHRKRRNV